MAIPLFDPHALPAAQPQTRLLQQQPAVAAQHLHPQALQARFGNPPPWQQEPRHEILPPQSAPLDAAVLIGLRPAPQAASPDPVMEVLFTQRSRHLPAHPGQISFPGGKIDDTDSCSTAAALREAHEEVGLHPADIEVLGALQPYVTGTGFKVTPVVALLPPQAPLVLNTQEVDEAFFVPLPFLMNPAHHRAHWWQPSADHRREWFSMPYTDVHTGQVRFIWGVTAGILRDLYRFLSA